MKTKQSIAFAVHREAMLHNEFVFLEVVKMVFSLEDLAKPTMEEIKQVKWIAKNNPDDLDSRELWVLENFAEGDDDDE